MFHFSLQRIMECAQRTFLPANHDYRMQPRHYWQSRTTQLDHAWVDYTAKFSVFLLAFEWHIFNTLTMLRTAYGGRIVSVVEKVFL